MRRFLLAAVAGLLAASPSFAGLVDAQSDNDANNSNFVMDGSIGVGEYSASYSGGGAGFGGTLGNGTLNLDADSSNLYLGFAPGADLNDNVVIFLDTKPGGVTDDTTLSDTADPGRNLSTNLVPDVADFYAIGADYTVVIGGFGIVVFELVEVNPGQIGFVAFDGTFTTNNSTLAREIGLSLATLGNPSAVDFFVAYGSDTNFMSDEGIPAQTFSGGGNLGFDNAGNGDVTWGNYNRFNIPEPATMSLLGFGAIALLRRRR